MRIVPLTKEAAPKAAGLVAQFRVALKSYRGIKAPLDPAAGLSELLEYLESGYPVWAAEENGRYLGYLVCRVEEPCVWVESLYVDGSARRRGVATLLFEQAEQLARSFGEETVYNYVHPTNHGMISFLRSRGYSVLNLLEIRKPYQGESPSAEIVVGDHRFDY